jgi:DNA-directed RNA polymerase subunit F
MLRLLNRFALDPEQKRRSYELIREINALIGDRAKPFALEPEAVRRIQAICPATADSLREMHEASLLRWNARYPSAKPGSI